MRVAGLALLALVAGGCVTVEVQPDAGSDATSESGAAAPTTASTADSQPDTSGPDEPHPPRTADSTETAPAPTDSTGPPTTDPPATSPTPTDSTEPPTTETPETGAGTTATDTESPPATEAPDTEPTSTTGSDAAATAESPESPETTEPLPGEPYEWGPAEGASLAVVGVDHDDVLNVRDVPFGEIIATLDVSNPYVALLDVRAAPSGELIASFDSWADAIVATGRTRKLPTTVWHEVRVAGVMGWSSWAYLAPSGATHDATAEITAILGETPEADTLIELGVIVGEAMASDEPPSRVVVVTQPIVFEALGEVTVDVLNVGDDSVLGFRLLVFATPGAEDWMSDDPGPFTLRTVERTILCYSDRGVTAGGLCV